MISEVWQPPLSGHVSEVVTLTSTQARIVRRAAAAYRSSPVSPKASPSPYARRASSTNALSVPSTTRGWTGLDGSSIAPSAHWSSSATASSYGATPREASVARSRSSSIETR